MAASTIATREAAGVVGRSLFGGCTTAGSNSTRSSPRWSAVAWARIRWARWIGSKVPPRMPSFIAIVASRNHRDLGGGKRLTQRDDDLRGQRRLQPGRGPELDAQLERGGRGFFHGDAGAGAAC